MPDPTKYTPAYDFSNFQASSPNTPLPGDRVDIEFQNIEDVIDVTIEALKDIRRSDGALQNDIVTIDSLGPTVFEGLAAEVLTALGPEAEAVVQEALPEWRGAWLTATVYDVNDLARENGSTYICLAAHTAGTFSADLSAGRWELFAQQGSPGPGTGDMLAANNLSDVASVATARTNLGGTATGVAVFTAADAAAARVAIGATGIVPTGGIIMWSGSIASVPSGWALCNGASGTPDLRDRFIVGAGSAYAPGATGGADNVTLTTAQMPGHTHSVNINTNTAGAHSHTFQVSSNETGAGTVTVGDTVIDTYSTSTAGDHAHNVSGTTASAGSGASHENRPPYYALAYIMKL